jgi:hypothetical protein
MNSNNFPLLGWGTLAEQSWEINGRGSFLGKNSHPWRQPLLSSHPYMSHDLSGDASQKDLPFSSLVILYYSLWERIRNDGFIFQKPGTRFSSMFSIFLDSEIEMTIPLKIVPSRYFYQHPRLKRLEVNMPYWVLLRLPKLNLPNKLLFYKHNTESDVELRKRTVGITKEVVISLFHKLR